LFYLANLTRHAASRNKKDKLTATFLRAIFAGMKHTAPAQLRAWINDRGIKINWLAANIGVNRTSLQLWLGGSRTPDKESRAKLIAYFAEFSELCEAIADERNWQ